jgi:ATP-dependent protease ClpP protease subunit
MENRIQTEQGHKIGIISIIGEIEGHDALSGTTKATKYEHMIPQLIQADYEPGVDGILMILNTIGGDVECGLAMAEIIASMKKPVVSLVMGGSHSIGIPLAVSADYSLIVPSATMMVHPVRTTGTILGAPQTFYQFHQMQERIVKFICEHSDIQAQVFEQLMFAKDTIAKDLGTNLVGAEAVETGLINEVGGLTEAIDKLQTLIL